ncbi:AraC family transcriptional regulator [Hymenobacter antarcticus]|uniref:HTH araC/xylS-type domain-containing protein n=1 Tax=Hymenobacter antarcticus TaxID=486270 RepID=A0ABP7R3K9_9BACT
MSEHDLPAPPPPSGPGIPNTVLCIKHMVCVRAVRVVRQELAGLGLTVVEVGLGWATVAQMPHQVDWPRLRETLHAARFALLEDPRYRLAEQAGELVDHLLRTQPQTLRHAFSVTLSKLLGVGYPQLSAAFSLATGGTLEHYLVSRRLALARELLETTPLTVNAIARHLGYSSLAHLSGQFRQATGCSPSQYRQRCGASDGHGAGAEPLTKPGSQTAI